MRRAALALAWAIVACSLGALPALGQSPEAISIDQIGEDLEFRHYYIAEGAPVSVNEIEALVGAHPDVYFVALAGTVADGADQLAADLLEVVGTGTVVVLSPDEVGAVSSEFDDATLSSALDAMIAQEDSYSVEFEQFAGALPGAGPSPAEEGGFPWVAVVIIGVVGFIGFTIWRSGRRQKAAQTSRLEEARTEIRHQMDVIADQIVKLADDPRTEKSSEALGHYRSASETFAQAEGRLTAATTLSALEDLSDDLDRARWDLEATTALMEGRSPPPAPVDEKPEHCFFDPTHGAGVEEAELKTSAGVRKVMICRADAEKLRRGEAPVPRDLPMGPQRVPAPQAPRSAGGSGLDWLDVFSVIVGGMGQGVDYNWPRQSSRRSSGGLGIPFPSRSSNRSSRSSSSSSGSSKSSSSGSRSSSKSSSSRSTPSSSGSRPKGRARRTR
ncbi:MAG TPA: DUF6676 family protein [Acidimicrobiia bacterium]|nr:DUF6676 family protein [Acidimicrobiia bacterium]